MASSFFVGSQHNNNNNRNNLRLSEDLKPARPRRKPSKATESRRNRAPQRGMGVEKLERMRQMSEMKDTKDTSSPSLPYGFIPTAFADPATMSHVSVPFGTFSGGAGGMNLIPQGFFVQKMEGNSKELPSIPNFLNCDFCASCYKKKRGISLCGNGMVIDGAKDMYADMKTITNGDLVYGNTHNLKPSAKVAAGHLCAYSFHQTPQGAPVVALHRKASTRGHGNVVKEYDFFPGHKISERNKTRNDMMMMMKMMGSSSSSDDAPLAMSLGIRGGEAAAAAASCVTTTTGTADDASTCMDLSLKLSY